MDAESSIHSFVIKIWLENTPKGAALTPWRGRITHVATGEYRSIKSMDEIAAFICSYLNEGHQKPAFRQQLASLIRRFRLDLWKW